MRRNLGVFLNDRRAVLRGVWVILALLAVALPRLLPAAPLDMLTSRAIHPDRTEMLGENFPGSAFFFAEGAFDPTPDAQVIQSRNVLGLDSVTAAPAMIFRGATALDSYRALNCLTSAIYYEAANEPDEGQRAVAQVVLNRVRSPLWPNSICGVVYQGSERTDMRCQFTFSCDGSMARAPSATAWLRARRTAQYALSGHAYVPVGLATHYHTLAVRPSWAATLHPVAVVGAHIFYRGMGANGTLDAFHIRYSGRETISGPARSIWPAKSAIPIEAFSVTPATARMADDTGPSPVAGASAGENLPESTIRPEYRNTGRPLI